MTHASRIILVLALLLTSVATAVAAAPVDIGTRLELMVDDHLVESFDGLTYKLHHPRRAEKVLTPQSPWEGAYLARKGSRTLFGKIRIMASCLFCQIGSWILYSARDPYEARHLAASQMVDKKTLARALMHICKRRGFLSNRKANSGSDGEDENRTGQMQTFERYLDQRKITLGQYLFERLSYRFLWPALTCCHGKANRTYDCRRLCRWRFGGHALLGSCQSRLWQAYRS